MARSCEAAHEDSKVEAQRRERYITLLLITDPWSKGDYSRYIREASMAMDGLPEGVSPSDRVPEQLLQAAPILKRRRRRNREGFPPRGVNIGEGGHRGDPQGSQEGARRGPGWGHARDPSGSLVVAPLSFFGSSGSFLDADFLYNFSGIFLGTLNSRKPEKHK